MTTLRNFNLNNMLGNTNISLSASFDCAFNSQPDCGEPSHLEAVEPCYCIDSKNIK